MGQSIEELAATAERSECEHQKLRQQEVKSILAGGRSFGYITHVHQFIAWYDRKRLQFALKRQQR